MAVTGYRNAIFAVAFIVLHGVHALDLTLAVKECAGVACNGFPVSVVIPLPKGEYQDTAHFRVTDASGTEVPAQFSTINRWWNQDNSLRHMLVQFQPVVGAFTSNGTGISTYRLKDDRAAVPVNGQVTVSTDGSLITVITGPLKFTVRSDSFNIIDEAWLDLNDDNTFSDGEIIVENGIRHGGVFTGRLPGDVQYDANRNDVSVAIEESGPMRVVIRVEAAAKYHNTTNHLHGYAVRIYAYAGKPYIKIDYQLQNSSKIPSDGTRPYYAWPLYFESMNIDFNLNLSSTTTRFGKGDNTVYSRSTGTGLFIGQEIHDQFGIKDLNSGSELFSGSKPDGFIDVSNGTVGIMAAVRNFWQMWPNGLCMDGSNKLSVQLFPEWSAQWYHGQISPLGLYWLEDMQHVYKEILLYFHEASVGNSELINLARTFQYYPVVSVDTAWYRHCPVSLDLSGFFSGRDTVFTGDYRKPYYGYSRTPYSADTSQSSYYYSFNWTNFLGDASRKDASGVGGWPYCNAYFMVSGQPRDYFQCDEVLIGEMNVRPQWMTGFDFAQDNDFLRLTDLPAGEWSWRKFDGYFGPFYDTLALSGSNHSYAQGSWDARDDEHAWFRHIEEGYYINGNPWVKDWYKFIAQFRRSRLNHIEYYTQVSSRAVAHSMSHALQAYRVTGDTAMIRLWGDYLRKQIIPRQDSVYGEFIDPGFQTGFLTRTLIDYMYEIEEVDPRSYAEAFNFLSCQIEWNYNYGNFPYFYRVRTSTAPAVSNGTSLTLVDPVSWYYWNTGKKKYWTHLETYKNTGINGGERPYGDFSLWNGRYEGRYYNYVKNAIRTDSVPALPVSNLQAEYDLSTRNIRLIFTSPSAVDLRRYHIVWKNKPISENTTLSTDSCNWWIARATGERVSGSPNSQTTIVFHDDSLSAGPLYAALFSFDSMNNMSAMSNLAVGIPGTVAIENKRVNNRPISLTIFPNPFNPKATIAFYLPKNSHVKIGLYDITGACLHVLLDKSIRAGAHNMSLNINNKPVSSGILFVKMSGIGAELVRKIVVLK
ncbi:MAG: hypothetical protein A2293_01445 [Elusimicrobia bacterium RIFOXYB2_FULL_49_7]|nr:MAG: hypothetical protein A2293_01445 [Elusimicrobia bacterium RIFOXYB2_FULL_49_7]